MKHLNAMEQPMVERAMIYVETRAYLVRIYCRNKTGCFTYVIQCEFTFTFLGVLQRPMVDGRCTKIMNAHIVLPPLVDRR